MLFRFLSVSVMIVAVCCFSFRNSGSLSSPKQTAPGIDTEQNRFTKVVLAQKLEEPMQFDFFKDGRVIFAERKGKLKMYNPVTGKVSIVAQIPVSTKYVSKQGAVSEAEDGLQGVILDPLFDKNHWIYLYYSAAGNDPKNILARYEMRGDVLVETSKKIVMEVVVQREECCHVGGGMLFDAKGNLYLSTGDNTFSRSSSGFTPIDERPGQSPRDAQKSSGNTNDLRGKILRIHPEPNGGYTIPEGNLFPKGTAKTRPEIYTMGNRNPWRLAIDSKSGWLYWGEVGPDGTYDTVGRGPKAYDEFNIAKQAGNYGWPYLEGNNQAYWYYDFATAKSGKRYDPSHPVNRSPNNTGLTDLPPGVPAMIWYPYIVSEEFPLLGSGSRSATGGPFYHRSDLKNPKRPYPDYYEGKWFVTDWARGWINLINVDDQGGYKSMERFLPNEVFRGPIDMDFGPDGDLYILEYGNGYFADNPEAQLVKIEYNAGNRKPVVQVASDKKGGALPFRVQLSSSGTADYDNDMLTYEWKLSAANIPPKIFKEANPVITISKPGIYTATLTVTDTRGAKNSKSIQLTAGNEAPVVSFDFNGANKSFFIPNQTISYQISVNDKEDGSLADKKIPASKVGVTIDYLSEGYDMTVIASKQRTVDASIRNSGALNLIGKSDCKACHNVATKSLGPAFTKVAEKYKTDAGALDRLSKKIISGGSGVWGDAAMPAHPAIAINDAKIIVRYILSLGEKQKIVSRPVEGKYLPQIPQGESDRGNFFFRASYTDKATKLAPALSSEDLVVLRNQVVRVSNIDKFSSIEFTPGRTNAAARGNGSYLELNKIDLTGVDSIEFSATANAGNSEGIGGIIEVRLDSPTGKLVAQTDNILPRPPGAPRQGRRGRIKAAVKEASGEHDVYFVFVNPKATSTDALVYVTDFKFDINTK